MNLLLFEPDELSGSLLRLDAGDRRARHIREVLGLRPGDLLRVGMINGKMGSGRITDSDGGGFVIEVRLTAPPPVLPAMELILALPRPIMLQRILKQATVLGVRSFHLIRSRRVQKSYFQSSVLRAETVREILLQGLEQAVDTRLPEVHVHERFRPFMEEVAPVIRSDSRLLAHPGTDADLAWLFREERIGGGIVLAVGPEGGWNEYELRCFLDLGYCPFSMGPRILHVDTAVLVLLSQLKILQELTGPSAP
ncbi:MAG TPA: 16S rRNA (uracil(1498)-N(3))-methyltransferase [Desulfobacteraceae bacterium]|nr:16S rRNA (uracil(1498)-N(3))-methyltransferase [Desulfobacteraceae bacterium]